MRIFLYGTTAFSHWLVEPSTRDSLKPVSAKAMRDCDPTPESLAYLENSFPHLAKPYHCMVAQRKRRSLPDASTHICTFPFKGSPFLRVGNGVYAASPELCFVQLACTLPFHELVKAGSALCSAYRFHPAARNKLADRHPLTSASRINAFLRRNPGLRGAKAARVALGSLVNDAASPPEAFLATTLGSLHRYGGFQLPDLQTNRRLRPSRAARAIVRQETIIPDISHFGARLAIEYDSNSEHLTPQQIAKDARRRLALEADGYKVITVTARQLASPMDMKRVAVEAGKRLGHRIRPQGKRFKQQQLQLFRTGWSLDAYLNPDWLHGGKSPIDNHGV